MLDKDQLRTLSGHGGGQLFASDAMLFGQLQGRGQPRSGSLLPNYVIFLVLENVDNII